jgi:hypothetical protein
MRNLVIVSLWVAFAIFMLSWECKLCTAQTVKPALPATVPGCCANCKSPNVPRCKTKEKAKAALPVAGTQPSYLSDDAPHLIAGSIVVLTSSPPCGYPATEDADGKCRETFDLHLGPDHADCRLVNSEDGTILQIACVWKPKGSHENK